MGTKPSPKVTEDLAAKIKHLLGLGELKQHDIAALFSINQGRVSEIKTGKTHCEVSPQPYLPGLA